ncbi:hypothetical protein LTR10_015066 [Elasticomyces elasticus]|uniref:Uncharacterized protein n=1 Tax=Exophiala sideris TaxID=1016849 RepID=A0ABR0JQT6_9EURO|nr:hypothetical protein LTR10_015066 [Elasticomyces elasticus]KAK5034737.1 hypothetical protein LTR13_006394 [Exophiala sideris]KAK5039942.1 hypothetical protein LTS07_000437 [Exophiala sideris]KAK5068321.1 hypothetical protein LTR69_000439 [Exophiala sideris]KAK5187622.1 hypothetical protein LTR44_000438 [Eurotiomycetes sp. CCFEE 6388]
MAQNGDGGGASGVQPGDIGSSSQGSENAGAYGGNSESVNLSQGATIAIAVVVSVVVVLVGTIAVLFFLAKKKQWKIAEGLRRSARRVTSAVKAVATPLTPKKMTFTFSPVEKRRVAGDEDGPFNGLDGRTGAKMRINTADLEKGDSVPVSVTPVVAGEDRTGGDGVRESKKEKKRPPKVEIPNSVFEMDSPKTPMWKRVFGR